MSPVILQRLSATVFHWRRFIIGGFVLVTLLMLAAATQLRFDAGYAKQVPRAHPYMQVFSEHADTFGGADRILVALHSRDGDMFTPAFFRDLQTLTDKLFFLPGVDRTQVRSLFTPNVRYTEVVEEGLRGGNVIPADFDFSDSALEQVRANILKADLVGRLVADDFSGALVRAELLETDPQTGERLDYLAVAEYLEREIRAPFAEQYDVHITGFAPLVGAIADAAYTVAAFFLIGLLVTWLLVTVYARSWRLAMLPIVCSLVAVSWQLGLLPLLGFGLDPMSMLVPFLVFAIGVSHGIQMLGRWRTGISAGQSVAAASRSTFERLLLPGAMALLTDTLGFVTILAIDIGIIREMALTASLGVAVVILTNLLLLPLLLAGVTLPATYRQGMQQRARTLGRCWRALALVAGRRGSLIVLIMAALLFAYGLYAGSQVHIGDRQIGVPELRTEARYNQDSRAIAERFRIGVDTLSVYATTQAQACTDHTTMQAVDTFAWRLLNHPQVTLVQSLPQQASHINAALNEGSLKWATLPRHPAALAQAVSHVPTSSGLLNNDCSVMPVIAYTRDHKAETITSIIDAIESHRAAQPDSGVDYRLAGGNVGVMAASNDVIAAAQFPILLYVYAAVILLCLLYFRSPAATVAIVLPLALTSLLTYALMSHLHIGLKISTLPVVALGVGIGIDYGIYIFSRLREYLDAGFTFTQAYEQTLASTGTAVLTTALTLSAGVMTWICSALQFQADMGMLLVFMFLVSMLGAMLLLPALARWLLIVNRT
ncbi:putative RND superfamily exporter protein [Methylohalomonas lacus]|uniref:RND superfamily exporter protein n=1 Tax=Methylohalomonas lacus TaxID=398773 RepID=A0AAE3HJM5_9GAMM|nr:MMPL family transporter [Methylohalomonas lacus]MCS3902341.1 putative RND superfamily exporter protein [Methylohalomonas lacus]